MRNRMIKQNLILFAAVGSLFLASCTGLERTMREPMTRVELYKSDFTLSSQMEAEAQTTRIIGIDWSRLFTKKVGGVDRDGAPMAVASVPVLGTIMERFGDRTANYALYNLMDENPGYDVVFYPQYERRVFAPIGIPFIYSTTTVKVKARLAKFN